MCGKGSVAISASMSTALTPSSMSKDLNIAAARAKLAKAYPTGCPVCKRAFSEVIRYEDEGFLTTECQNESRSHKLDFYQGAWMPQARRKDLMQMERDSPSKREGGYQDHIPLPPVAKSPSSGYVRRNLKLAAKNNVAAKNVDAKSVASEQVHETQAQAQPDASVPQNRSTSSVSVSVRNLTDGGLLLQKQLGVNSPLLELLEELKHSFREQDFQLVTGLAMVRDAHDTPASLGMKDGAEVFVVDATVQINIRNLCGDVLLQSRLGLNNPLSDLLDEHHKAHPGMKFHLVSSRGKILSPHHTVSELGLTDDVEVTAIAAPVPVC